MLYKDISEFCEGTHVKLEMAAILSIHFSTKKEILFHFLQVVLESKIIV